MLLHRSRLSVYFAANFIGVLLEFQSHIMDFCQLFRAELDELDQRQIFLCGILTLPVDLYLTLDPWN